MKNIGFCLLCCTLVSIQMYSQSICYTVCKHENLLTESTLAFASNDDSYHLRVFFHFIKKTNGTGEYSLSDANILQCMDILNEDFSPHNIYFHLAGYDYIYNSTYYNLTSWYADTTMYGKITSTNAHQDAIDVYFLPYNSYINGGRANGIPGNAVVIGGSINGCILGTSHVLSHEIGHCLGLFHTFHGSHNEQDFTTCRELVNGSNCSTCGDYVCDTPADPFPLFDYVDTISCTWINNTYHDPNNQLYMPDTKQIMAYISPLCMEHFSIGQGERMRQHIATQQKLIDCTVPTIRYVQNRTFSGNGVEYINAIDSIITGSNVTTVQTYGDVVIENGKKVIFEVGKGIRLENGFIVKQGAHFETQFFNPNNYIQNKHITKHHNEYIPMLSNGKSWFSIMYGFEPPAMGTISTIVKDTTIHSTTYYVMNEDIVAIGEESKFNYHGRYLLREDIDKQQVYLLNQNIKREQLLYDFSLSIGDSLPMQPKYTLTSIKDVYNTNTKRRNFIFTNHNNDTILWIEGVGNYSALMHPFAMKHDNISKIICIEKNEEIVYDSGNFIGWFSCEDKPEITTNISQQATQTPITISPTITEKSITISGTTSIDNYEIYNTYGAIILRGNSQQIDVSALSSGIYIILIHTKIGQYSYRFLKL